MTRPNIAAGPGQKDRVERLRDEVRRLGGVLSTEMDIPPDLEEEFLKQVIAYEHAEPITLFQLLEKGGLKIPAPADLDDGELTARLWEMIERMSSMGAYLVHTNHLNDRELYTYLCSEALLADAFLFPERPDYTYTIDLAGSGSEEDNQLFLKYYADAEARAYWARNWPGDEMPAREQAPYTRDSHLPQPFYAEREGV
jgi:hypothetical protein